MSKTVREEAQNILKQIDDHIDRKPDSSAICDLNDLKKTINKLHAEAGRKKFSAAFIGTVGIGKTSAICSLLDLYTCDKKEKKKTMLAVRSGRTTICSVKIKSNDEPLVEVKPVSEDSLQATVKDFCKYIWRKKDESTSSNTDEIIYNRLSTEEERCIRNMVGLTKKSKSSDRAIEEAKKCESLEEFYNLVYEYIEVDKRTETKLRPDQNVSDIKEWMRDTFSNINFGKNPRVSIPAEITILGNFEQLVRDKGKFESTWVIEDMRGIDDGNVDRDDIKLAIKDSQKILIVCSGFNNAPAEVVKSFAEYAERIGNGHRITEDAVLLILEKHEESKYQNDIDEDISEELERIETGRDLQIVEAEDKMREWSKPIKSALVFDAESDLIDDSSRLWKVLEDKRKEYIERKNQELKTVCDAAQEKMQSEEKQLKQFDVDVKEIIEKGIAETRINLEEWSDIFSYIHQPFENSHHRVIAASISRRGLYYNLDIYSQFATRTGIGCREKYGKGKEKIKGDIYGLKERYPNFENQINQKCIEIDDKWERFLTEVENLVSGDAKKHWHTEPSKEVESLWEKIDDWWGQGSGYIERVKNDWKSQFEQSEPPSGCDEFFHKLTVSISQAWVRFPDIRGSEDEAGNA